MTWNLSSSHKPGENRSHVMSRRQIGQNNAQIARALGISRPRVTQIIDMEVRRLLEKGEHPLDLKEKYHLTDAQIKKNISKQGYTQYRDEMAARKEDLEKRKQAAREELEKEKLEALTGEEL